MSLHEYTVVRSQVVKVRVDVPVDRRPDEMFPEVTNAASKATLGVAGPKFEIIGIRPISGR